FSAPDPGRLNTFVTKLDLNLTANGNHKLFVRGNLQDDRNTEAVQQFPGEPPNVVRSGDSKGVSLGYTAILSSNLINNFRYGLTREGFGDSGANHQHYVSLRGLNPLNAPSGARSAYVNVPVNNFQDDVTWTKGKHTVQFGGNWRIIYNNRISDTA